jgi:hypothetical protein
MADSEKEKAAWKICDFCSKSTYEIVAMIREKEEWENLPLHYKCAWKRICQVGFGRFGRKILWNELCEYRAKVNNQPSYNYSPSYWAEGRCEYYRSVETELKGD